MNYRISALSNRFLVENLMWHVEDDGYDATWAQLNFSIKSKNKRNKRKINQRWEGRAAAGLSSPPSRTKATAAGPSLIMQREREREYKRERAIEGSSQDFSPGASPNPLMPPWCP